jgi:hypothetical protein
VATTVSQAFTEFAAKIKPTQAQEQEITSRRNAVTGYLTSSHPAGSAMPLLETRVIGSAGRKTLIRPVSDIDIFAVFDDSQVWNAYKNDSKQLLYRVREALSEYRVETVGSRGQAVRLFYDSGPHVDITPAFRCIHWLTRTPAGYMIPRGDGTWLQTDPYVHHDFMVRRNGELDNYLKPLVRLLKRWNRSHSGRLKSFHLEMMVQASFKSLGSNNREAVTMFFDWAGQRLDVNDPAGYSGNLASTLTRNQREDVIRSFAYAYEHCQSANNAESNGETAEALRQWRIVFGSEFPAYG